MAKEIERKFLVGAFEFKSLVPGAICRQGYLSTEKERTVRVRSIDDKGYLTIKGITTGASRVEYEYEIPVKEAEAMLANLCEKPLIEKIRYRIPFAGLTWEIDEFLGDNDGLIIAEVELKSEQQEFDKPDWIGKEVTSESRYYNSNLSKNPFKSWK